MLLLQFLVLFLLLHYLSLSLLFELTVILIEYLHLSLKLRALFPIENASLPLILTLPADGFLKLVLALPQIFAQLVELSS